MIYLLDTDMKGIASIRKPVESGLVQHIPVGTLAEYESVCEKLVTSAKPGDLVIVDTFSKLQDILIGDIKLGCDMKAMAPFVGKLMKEDNFGGDYRAASQISLRWLRFLRNRGSRIITTAHERMQEDKLTYMKKYGPDVSASTFGSLNGSASDIFRLKVEIDDVVDGEGRVVRPAYSRTLQLRVTDEALAKFNVDFEVAPTVPAELPNPTLPRLYKALQCKPEWLVIYGAPGSGKSTLAVSEAREPVKKA